MRCCVKAEHPAPVLFTSCPHCTKCDLVVEKMDKRTRIGAVAVLWHFFLLLLFLLKGTWQHTGFGGGGYLLSLRSPDFCSFFLKPKTALGYILWGALTL